MIRNEIYASIISIFFLIDDEYVALSNQDVTA